ncbi:hypothetical protein AB0N07_15520 [Streptomyces sp. NPDC051172]|uniref:hypothetical protein n=1 Tax=Streptomyces sp. NPDC051172 TaxID=3155796 RepID=UPI00343D0DE6
MPGTGQVTDCHRATGAWSDLWEDGWACAGAFESDDHRVRIAAVGIAGILTSPPDEPLAARVDGASARTATEDSSGLWKWPAAFCASAAPTEPQTRSRPEGPARRPTTTAPDVVPHHMSRDRSRFYGPSP